MEIAQIIDDALEEYYSEQVYPFQIGNRKKILSGGLIT